MYLYKFALGKYVTNIYKLRGKSGARMVNTLFASISWKFVLFNYANEYDMTQIQPQLGETFTWQNLTLAERVTRSRPGNQPQWAIPLIT